MKIFGLLCQQKTTSNLFVTQTILFIGSSKTNIIGFALNIHFSLLTFDSSLDCLLILLLFAVHSWNKHFRLAAICYFSLFLIVLLGFFSIATFPRPTTTVKTDLRITNKNTNVQSTTFAKRYCLSIQIMPKTYPMIVMCLQFKSF